MPTREAGPPFISFFQWFEPEPEEQGLCQRKELEVCAVNLRHDFKYKRTSKAFAYLLVGIFFEQIVIARHKRKSGPSAPATVKVAQEPDPTLSPSARAGRFSPQRSRYRHRRNDAGRWLRWYREGQGGGLRPGGRDSLPTGFASAWCSRRCCMYGTPAPCHPRNS